MKIQRDCLTTALHPSSTVKVLHVYCTHQVHTAVVYKLYTIFFLFPFRLPFPFFFNKSRCCMCTLTLPPPAYHRPHLFVLATSRSAVTAKQQRTGTQLPATQHLLLSLMPACSSWFFSNFLLPAEECAFSHFKKIKIDLLQYRSRLPESWQGAGSLWFTQYMAIICVRFNFFN